MEKQEIKEHIGKGYFKTRILFEIIGNPEEYVEKALDAVLSRVKNESKIIFLKEEIGKPKKTGDGLFGVYCEAEVLIPDLYTLSWVAFNFSPANIEILEPTKATFTDKQLSDLFNDLLGHIHEGNTSQVEMKSLNTALLRNMNSMTRNAVLVALGNTEMRSSEIGKRIGIQAKDLEPVLEAMIKEKKIIKNGQMYKRV